MACRTGSVSVTGMENEGRVERNGEGHSWKSIRYSDGITIHLDLAARKPSLNELALCSLSLVHLFQPHSFSVL